MFMGHPVYTYIYIYLCYKHNRYKIMNNYIFFKNNTFQKHFSGENTHLVENTLCRHNSPC